MKQCIFYALLLLCAFTSVAAQESSSVYSQIKIDLTQTNILTVGALGLETDHGHYAKGRHLINAYSQRELALLAANGIAFEILIPDVKADYQARVQAEREHGHNHDHSARSVDNCDGINTPLDYDTPVNYTYGSMGGYMTYDELLATLDSMAAKYPNLITPKMQIGDIVSNQGRPIWHLRLSDNPAIDEDEPEVLYTALHHAREPNSLAQMIFYIWYLLENYETDPEVQYLVDNTEMYFIPCINPDGYVYNQLTDPSGGGFWRKNRRQNDDGSFGVDLNRNYGFEWGFDDNGSSPNPDSETYRGTEGFSEPETQAVRDLCNAHNFRITLNYHTFGNLLIYPWGYSDGPTPDQATFTAMTDVMTRENNYFAGTGTETVGYTVNGDSDDWMYGEEDTKPAIYSMTPEVGPNFWPTQGQIDGLNKDCMHQNLSAAHLLLNYGEASEVDGSEVLTELEGSIDLLLKKYGLLDGELTVTVFGTSNDITMVGNNSSTVDLAHLEENSLSFPYQLTDQLEEGTELAFVVAIDNGQYVLTDTLRKTFGGQSAVFTVLLEDNGSNLFNWTAFGNWDMTSEAFVSQPSSYTDSPFDRYNSDEDAIFRLNEGILLENIDAAKIEFYARWDIENNYDYTQIMISTDGLGFTPLCGLYTNPGSTSQGSDQPLYDGTQNEWVLESIDISDYIGQTVYFQFYFYSDGSVEEDGFYFDDFTVSVVEMPISSISSQTGQEIMVDVAPNPFNENLLLSFELPASMANVEAVLVDALGRNMLTQLTGPLGTGRQQITLNTEKLAKGFYFLQLIDNNGQLLSTQKVVKR